jgi:NPH3 family
MCDITLHGIPGGPKSFELVAKFCYGEKFVLTSSNVVPVICAAYYLDMNEEYMTGNLISRAANFLSYKVLSDWKESLTALLSCEHVFNIAEKLDIVSACIDSLASKVTYGKLSYLPQKLTWNGIECTDATPLKVNDSGSDWWYDDVSSLRLPLFKRLIGSLGASGHDPANISGAVIYYWNKVHPGLNPNSTGVYLNDLRMLLEEMVTLLPVQKGVTSTKTLLSLLSTSLMYNANVACIESLEKRIGSQLDESILEDLLVPNFQGPYDPKHASKKNESKYDIDCIQRIIEQFVAENLRESEITLDLQDEEDLMETHWQELDKVAAVADLIDGYLMKIARDANLNFQQFYSLASAIPASARSSNDDFYHAIDVYLQV